ncbi:MAG TPA: hypothetical protein VHU80_10880 [Polyangiaceae bacterium]|jgi:hypothetical protein|nr:hypothetical protein [Polyangiaceae bacterium]
MIWRRGDAAERYAERRRREEEAPRLLAVAPGLESLRLEIEEHRAGGTLSEAAHVRRIVVDRAPALFVLPCHDAACKGGGHDITHDVLRSLRERSERFTGESPCNGQVGSSECRRVLVFVGVATYKPKA